MLAGGQPEWRLAYTMLEHFGMDTLSVANLAEHRRRLDTAARSRRMEQQIVRRIEARNPAIGQHLANNMKDYIVFRFKEDFN